MAGEGGREECIQQRIAREIYGKIIVWMRREEIRAGVLEEVRKNWRRWKRNPFAKISRNPFLRIKQQEEDEIGNIGNWDSEL